MTYRRHDAAPEQPRELRLDNARAKITATQVRIIRRGAPSPARGAFVMTTPPTTISNDYARALLGVTDHYARAFHPLLAELPRLMEAAARQRQDAGEGRRAAELVERARKQMEETVDLAALTRLAEKYAQRTSGYQKDQLAKQTRDALGADVIASDKRVLPAIEAFADRNAGLIKDIGEQLAGRIRDVVLKGFQDGRLHGDIATEIASKFGLAENRARFIARDQVGKLYGQTNAIRQREMGIEAFTWRSVEDERVRPLHADYDGQTFRYDALPREGLPGEPPNCRCFGEPDFSAILGA